MTDSQTPLYDKRLYGTKVRIDALLDAIRPPDADSEFDIRTKEELAKLSHKEITARLNAAIKERRAAISAQEASEPKINLTQQLRAKQVNEIVKREKDSNKFFKHSRKELESFDGPKLVGILEKLKLRSNNKQLAEHREAHGR